MTGTLPANRPSPARAAWLAAAVLSAVAFLAYAPTLSFDLVWDDTFVLEHARRSVRDGNPLSLLAADYRLLPYRPLGYYRPLVLLSFHADSLAAPFFPAVYHLTNVLLHAAVTLLVFLIGKAVLKETAAAALSGLLFALHPVHVESVAFVSGRTDLWAAFFCLLSALAWLGRPAGGGRRLVLVPAGALAYGLAMLSKETAAVLPAALLAWEILRPSGAFRVFARLRGRLPELAAHAAVLGVVLYLRLGVAGVGFGGIRPAAPQGGHALAVGIWANYLKLLVFPWPQVPYYLSDRLMPGAGTILGALAALGLFLAAASRAGGRTGLRGLAWTALFLLSVAGLVPLSGAPAAERFLYLPSVGFCLAAGGAAMPAMRRWPRAAAAATGAAAAGLAAAVLAASGTWRSDLSLGRRLVRTAPAYSESHDLLARAYLAGGRYGEALDTYRRAVARWPGSAILRYNLGVTFTRLGRIAEAEGEFRRAAAIDPAMAPAWNNLGVALMARGASGEAHEAFRRAVAADPGNAAFRDNMTRLAAGRPPPAP